ncbi:MAG TPA: hypothetical protein VJ385_14435 [Fibrobacteria bacterium]|nr:hypothetical protein [Fibrobacteria bacterium]
MYKKLATIAAFALLATAGAQAQVLNCSLSFTRNCIVQGVLDADGFSVVIGPIGGTYSMETLPFVAAQSNDTKIMTSNGVTLLADDELGRGYDRFVCGPNSCPNAIKVMPFSSATNNTVRFMVTQLN